MAKHIQKAQPDWMGLLNAFMDGNELVDSGWQTDGITAVNGYSISSQGVQYRTLRLGTIATLTQLNIALQVTQTLAPQNLDAIKLPTAVFPNGITGQNGKNGFLTQWTKSTNGATDLKLTITSGSVKIWNLQNLAPVSESNGIMHTFISLGTI